MNRDYAKRLDDLREKLSGFGKENLHDILHFIGVGLEEIFGFKRCRIYLEDLTEGLLICAYAMGEMKIELQGTSIFILPQTSLVARAFVDRRLYWTWRNPEAKKMFNKELASKFNIKEMAAIPIIYNGKSIGVITVDSSKEGEIADEETFETIKDFIFSVSHSVDRAKRFHQHLKFSKKVDEAKIGEAASQMMRSAVKIVGKLTLASVLIPNEEKSPLPPFNKGGDNRGDYMKILATYSSRFEDKDIYEDRHRVDIIKGESLIERIVYDDPERGIIYKYDTVNPLYIPDVKTESFKRKPIAEKIGLTSLYMVPRFDPVTKKIICVVNYYTKEKYKFTQFEEELLCSHAEMVEKVIRDVGREHIEIEVLSEIAELLSEPPPAPPLTSSLSPPSKGGEWGGRKGGDEGGVSVFATKVLSKANELIDADTGSIAIVRNIDGVRWLVVENEDGTLIGAKSRGWRKKAIPPLKVGGEDLERRERSLTGYVAHTKMPYLCNDVKLEAAGKGFYREVSEDVGSELAIPILYGDEVIGIINLDSFKKGFFTEEHKRILTIITSLVSSHIHDLLKIQELQKEVHQLKEDIGYRAPNVSSYSLGNIIGKSPKIKDTIDVLNKIVTPVFNRIVSWREKINREERIGLSSLLIMGETGSGKEMLFNNIYSRLNELYKKELKSNLPVRSTQTGNDLPLKKTNIAAYSGELTYSELFGHKKGSFTGADSDRKGILEEADGGVVFLDEIGDADPKTQVQLLRFLDNGGFYRLGENRIRYSRVFLIAATNKDLNNEIRHGRFREDLYYRLSELSIVIPPLRERREDIPDLSVHFLSEINSVYGRGNEIPLLNKKAVDFLLGYEFKGNVRELRSILLRAYFLKKGREINRDDLITAIGIESTRLTGGKVFSSEDTVSGIYESIVSDVQDFWSALYEPFINREINRETVKLVLNKARLNGDDSLPKLAVRLKACKEGFNKLPAEKKKFISFRNFLYKTVKITA
ncbi:MAG: sigma 54-interacting transcriptional regulator [Nitrospinae bacterium]|nr:sigma 54-interacting transcriptional regulator [Nitrospinota bacterium]